MVRKLSLGALDFARGLETAPAFVVPGLFAVVLVLVAALEVSVPGPEFFSVAPVFAAASRADIAEPPTAACTRALSALSAPVAEPVVLDDSSGHPRFVPAPNVDYYATSANFG